MSDLISREKVKQAIREYFKEQIEKSGCIDTTTDEVENILTYNKYIQNAIDAIQVEFDVDKVVDELVNMKSEINHLSETNCQLGNYPMATICDAQTSILASSIEIVERGGIE